MSDMGSPIESAGIRNSARILAFPPSLPLLCDAHRFDCGALWGLPWDFIGDAHLSLVAVPTGGCTLWSSVRVLCRSI